MRVQILKVIALISLSLGGVLGILSLWGIIASGEMITKIMVTSGIIFVITALAFEILRKDSPK